MNEGERLKELRSEKGMTQTNLANLLGYKEATTISKKEKDDLHISTQDLKKLYIAEFDIIYIITGIPHQLSKYYRESDKIKEDKIDKTLTKLFKEYNIYICTFRYFYGGYGNRINFLFQEILEELNQKRMLKADNYKLFLKRRIEQHKSNIHFSKPVKKQLLKLVQQLNNYEFKLLVKNPKSTIKLIDKRMLKIDIKTYKFVKNKMEQKSFKKTVPLQSMKTLSFR